MRIAPRLEGKIAIVTGGGTGIGEAICKKFAREGAAVVVCGFSEDPVDDVVRTSGLCDGKYRLPSNGGLLTGGE